MEVTIREANQGPGLNIKKNNAVVHDTTETPAEAPAPVEEVVETPVEAPAEEAPVEDELAQAIAEDEAVVEEKTTDGIKKID